MIRQRKVITKKVRKPQKPKSKGAKVESIPSLVKKLDKAFSIFIRSRYQDEKGMIKCYTCAAYKPFTQMQCGHFFSRRHYSIRWDEDNARPQCAGCNLFNQGRQYEFGKALIKEIGQERVDILERKKNNVMKLDRFVLETLIKQYK